MADEDNSWRKVLIVTGSNRQKVAEKRLNHPSSGFRFGLGVDLDQGNLDWNSLQFQISDLIEEHEAVVITVSVIENKIFNWLSLNLKTLLKGKVEVIHEET